VHTGGRGRGKRLLYWFRTPPAVRVGRAPIDETAIRLLEQHNPDVQFDWTRILKAPPAEPGRRDARDRDQRGRREPRAQRPRSGGGPPVNPTPQPPRRNTTPDSTPVAGDAVPDEFASERAEAAEYSARAEAAELAAERGEHGTSVEGHAEVAAEHADHTESAVERSDPTESAADRPERPEPRKPDDEPAERFEARPEDVGSASYVRLGAEGLVRLRARYAEVMARIAERPLEEDAREELKQRAERLNPDAWVTADEVTAALEQYETVFEGLRGVVGRHPSRRRRGRR